MGRVLVSPLPLVPFGAPPATTGGAGTTAGRESRCPAILDLERDPPYTHERLPVRCDRPTGHDDWHRNRTGGRVVLRLPGIAVRLVAGEIEWQTEAIDT